MIVHTSNLDMLLYRECFLNRSLLIVFRFGLHPEMVSTCLFHPFPHKVSLRWSCHLCRKSIER